MSIVSILSLFAVGLLSPGPDFSLVVKNALTKGRYQGYMTALGIALGVSIHISYCVILGLILEQYLSHILPVIKVMGGTYLIYLGIKSLFLSPTKKIVLEQEIIDRDSFKQGLVTNLLNPNAILFFISIFSGLLGARSFLSVSRLGVCMIAIAMVWFLWVAYIFSTRVVDKIYQEYMNQINKLFGVILIFFGLQLLKSLLH